MNQGRVKDNMIFLFSIVILMLMTLGLSSGIHSENNLQILIVIARVILSFIYFIKILSENKLKKHVVFVFFVHVLLTIYLSLNINPLKEPDSQRYFAYATSFDNLSSFLMYSKSNLFVSSYVMYGLTYVPFFLFFGHKSKFLVQLLNSFFLWGIMKKWLDIMTVIDKTEDENIELKSWLFSIMMLSGNLNHYSFLFLKDIANLYFIVSSIESFLKKRKLKSFLFALYSFTFRSYSIVTIIIVVSFLKGSQKILKYILSLSMIVVYYIIGKIGILNSVYNFFGILFSPNPFKIKNYLNVFFPTIETLIFLVFLILNFRKIFYSLKQRKYMVVNVFLVLIIYSLMMTLIGYYALQATNIKYSLFVAGDDISRKKLPISLLLYTFFSYLLLDSKDIKRKGRIGEANK